MLPLVVRAGAGSVRDSMSVMDQLLAGAGEEGVTYAMATSLLGYTDGSLLDSVVEAFATGDGAAAFEVVDRVIEGGNDPRRFVADLLERLRDLVILAAVPDAADKGLIDAPADVLERMQAQAGTFGPAELGRAADIVNEGLTEMRGATSPRLQLELICARVPLPAAYGDERSLMARLDRIERGVQFSAAVRPPECPRWGTSPVRTPTAGQPLRLRPSSNPAAVPPRPEPPSGRRGSRPPRPRLPRRRHRPRLPLRRRPPPPLRRPRPPPHRHPHPLRRLRPPPPPPAPGPPPPRRAEAVRARAPPARVRPGAPADGPRPPPRAAARAGRSRRSPPLRRLPLPSTPSAPPASAAPPGGGGGGLDPRMLWPNILETVKNRRRFTWILLSQNAQVTGFDGTTLQLGFVNAGARDNFLSSGSEDVLRQALTEQFNVQWKIEAVVDPSGGWAAVRPRPVRRAARPEAAASAVAAATEHQPHRAAVVPATSVAPPPHRRRPPHRRPPLPRHPPRPHPPAPPPRSRPLRSRPRTTSRRTTTPIWTSPPSPVRSSWSASWARRSSRSSRTSSGRAGHRRTGSRAQAPVPAGP
ncbi:hypothetical protein STENM223S_01197 [Streptomyces tendae]